MKRAPQRTTAASVKTSNKSSDNDNVRILDSTQDGLVNNNTVNIKNALFLKNKQEKIEFSNLKQISLEKSQEEKSKDQKTLEIIEKIWSEAADSRPLLRLSTDEDVALDGRFIQIEGKKLINFSSCSYFGLEMHPFIKEEAKKAIDMYGVQFSSTRAAVSINLYEKVENNLRQIFGTNTLLTPTTTHAHLSAIPLLVQEGDVVLIDQQVHNSLQMALQLLSKKNISPITIPHSNIEVLQKVIEKQNKNSKIWFFCDGVYSIYGDLAPIKKLQELQKKYPNFYLYIDDAHGVGIFGQNGKGYALSQLEFLEKTIVAISTSKCFGCAGGALIIPDIQLFNLIKKFGQPLIFGGPIQPPLLGALWASTTLFLSNEIQKLQNALQKKISLRNQLLIQNKVPVIGPSETPLTFIPIGSHRTAGSLFRKLFDNGVFVNPALFPVVGRHHNGIRFTTTLHQTDEDINKLISLLGALIPSLVPSIRN